MRIPFVILLLFNLSVLVHAQEPTKNNPLAGDAEAGIVSANGNNSSSSYLAKGAVSYKFNSFLIGKIFGDYLKNKSHDNAAGTTTESEKWIIGPRLERELTPHISVYVGQNFQSDKPAGIYRRYNTDLGGKYYIYKEETHYLFAELGYRFVRENYTDPTKNTEDLNYIRTFIEGEKKWTPSFSSKAWAEYLQRINDSEDYAINSEVSINAALDSTFSIKLAYSAKYDNTPASTYKTDTLFSTSLIAKF